MLEVPVYNRDGKQIDRLKVDEDLLGSTVNAPLLKQVIVAYHANRRQGTAATRGRGMVAGSTRKMFRQKGTGRARRGPIRTSLLRGGGRTFAKRPRSYGKGLPKKMRRAALKSAILAKILGSDLLVIDQLSFDVPKTKEMAQIVRNLKIDRTCLVTLARADDNVFRSSRNIPDLTVCVVANLNAFDVATRRKMLVTSEAMQTLLAGRPQEATA